MKAFSLIVKYWWIVIMRAVRVAWDKTDMRGWVIATLLVFLLAVFVRSLVGLNVVSENTLTRDVLSSFWVQLLTGVIVWIGLVSGVVFGLIYIPAKIYDEQGGFLNNPFNLVPVPRESDIQSGQQVWASIDVYNEDKQANIENCYLRLDEVTDLSINQSLLLHKQNLTWSGREHNDSQSGNQSISITAGDFRVCDIAMTVPGDNKVNFTMWFGGLSVSSGTYKLEMKVYGTWKGHPINHNYSFILHYEGKNKLRLEGPMI